MKKILIILIVIIGLIWIWEANFSEDGLLINIPTWIAGNNSPTYMTWYFIRIHKSQIHRYGTLWSGTYYPGKTSVVLGNKDLLKNKRYFFLRRNIITHENIIK